MPIIDLGSVVGPQGPQGATGATGATGAQGNPGPNSVGTSTSTTINGVLAGNGSKVVSKTVDSEPNSSHASNLITSAAVADAIKGAGNFAAPTTIDNGTDLNTLTAAGCYRCASTTAGKSMINAPWAVGANPGEAFVLFVVKNNVNNSTYFIQQMITPTRVYTRRSYEGTWSDWTSMRQKVEDDLASISIWGTTNTTGSSIASGTYFYLNGNLVRAIASIANNASFTSGTNYETVSGGVLNSLLQPKGLYRILATLTKDTAYTYTFTGNTAFLLLVVRYASGASSYSGVYYGIASATSGVSFVAPIISNSHAAVTVSERTLSVTPDSTSMYAYIVPMNSTAMA